MAPENDDPNVQPLEVLESRWPTGEAFLSAYLPGGADTPGRFWHPLAPDQLPPRAPVGAMLSVRIWLTDRAAEFRAHMRRLAPRAAGAAELGLCFIREERDREELIVGCAQGESVSYRRRRKPRIACHMTVRVTIQGKVLETRSTEISASGVHLALEELLEQGAIVSLFFQLPGEATPISLQARVMSLIASGPQRGVGLEFLFTSARQRDAFEVATKVLGPGTW